MSKMKWIAACSAVFWICVAGGWSTTPGFAETSAEQSVLAQTNPTDQVITVGGFRSAKYGMDEAAVRAAIKSDFGLDKDQILAGENAVERTKLLTVAVPDLIPGGGTAQVSYVFGYTSNLLIQVGATWSAKTDPKLTQKMLYDNGDLLRSHFIAEAYQPDSVKTNVALPNGILLFRAADAQNHATLLLLQGSFTTTEDGRKTLNPASLDLLYSANPDNPDIFKLATGSF